MTFSADAFVEMEKFAVQFDPDAKFERVQPQVPRNLEEVMGANSGPLPRMGTNKSGGAAAGGGGGGGGFVAGKGSTCPICETRFAAQDELIKHLEVELKPHLLLCFFLFFVKFRVDTCVVFLACRRKCVA